MKQLLLLLGVIFILAIEARNVQETLSDSTSDDTEDNTFLKHIKENAANQMRHRRRPRQSHYDYWNPYFYDNVRRDDRHQDDVLAQILKQLDELSAYVKRPAPPIYVPYPIVYPVPQYKTCFCGTPSKTNVTFPDRLPEMDENQNWGPVIDEIPAEVLGSEDDGTRPIVLRPIESLRPINKQPPVEHGSSQAGVETTTRTPVNGPGMCQAAILSCCRLDQQQRQSCFARYGCQKTFRTGAACRPDVIKRVILQFSEAYAPSIE